MKTGFICASGFNLVATATRNNKRLIAVVLGAPSSAARAMKAAQLLERGFSSSQGALSWLTPSLGQVEALQPVNVDPPNLRDEMCGGHRRRATEEDPVDMTGVSQTPDSPYGVFLSALRPADRQRRRPDAGRSAWASRWWSSPGRPKGQGQVATVDPKPAKGMTKPVSAVAPAAAAAVALGQTGLDASKSALAPSEAAASAVPLPGKRPGATAQPGSARLKCKIRHSRPRCRRSPNPAQNPPESRQETGRQDRRQAAGR